MSAEAERSEKGGAGGEAARAEAVSAVVPAGPPAMPVESGAPVVRGAAVSAGGLPAVAASARYALREAGVVRSVRALLRVNQQDGFDCPSCAWPDPGERAVVEFCENGAKAVADEATRKRVGPEFFAQWPVAQLLEQPDVWLNAQGRLTHPVVLRDAHAEGARYEEISWDEAFDLIGRELNSLASPDRAVFYTSGRTSNEAAFLYQLFIRQYGTNNMPDCSNMCHESSGTGLNEVLGVGKGAVQLSDFERARAVFVIGQNPGTNHPRMLSALREAKQRGAAIVSINPLREPGLLHFRHPQKVEDVLGEGVGLSDLYLQVRVGGDAALLRGIARALFEEEDRRPGAVLDRKFIAEHTSGFEAYERAVRAHDWADLVRESGVAEQDIRQAARVMWEADGVIACWAMGITQHRFGVQNVQEIVNLLLLRGNVGRPGAGPCPVRGHSNVQGDRTMGVWEKPPAWIGRLGEEFGFEPPRAHGLDVVGAIEAMADGRAEVFFALGGNFLSAAPDTEHTAAALRRCRLTVQVSTKLNRSHLVTGKSALILPCLGRTERDVQQGRAQFVTVEDSMSVVHRSEGRMEPASPALRSEVAIVAGAAKTTLGARSRVDWDALAGDYDRVREAIARVVPGFEGMNERVRAPNGFVLPNGARERVWRTRDGRARFTAAALPRLELSPGELVMTTVRTHDQFNTTVYDVNDRYRGIYGHRRVALMNKQDMDERGLTEGAKVTLVSRFRGEERVARGFVAVAYDLPRGCVATYFPEANALIPAGSYAEGSRTPTSKSVPVTVTAE